MDYEMFGKRIRDERLLLRLTIEQLAEMVNKSTNYIGQIERNDGKPSLETVVDIANALGTTVDSLLADSLDKYRDDKLVQEIETFLYPMDEYGKQFILDVIKRYSYYHKKRLEDHAECEKNARVAQTCAALRLYSAFSRISNISRGVTIKCLTGKCLMFPVIRYASPSLRRSITTS